MAQHDLEQASKQNAKQRRCTDRQRLREAAEQLLTPEGWMRWVLTRATLSGYSAANCMLLAAQCHERGIEPRHVCGESAWRKLGRRVRDGEAPLNITAPVKVGGCAHDRERNSRGAHLLFRTAFVYEFSQTEPLPDRASSAAQPSREPLDGDSHIHLLPPLQAFAESLGYSVSFEPLAGAAQGTCDREHRRIAVKRPAPANAQVRALIHECAHALGSDYESYGRDRAEVIAEAVTYVVASGVGLELEGESPPYVASWSKDGAIEAITEFAQTIDKLARRLERALRHPARPR